MSTVLEEKPRVFSPCNKLNNSIVFDDYRAKRGTGYKTVKPRPGDLFECLMASGRTCVYRFVTVHSVREPNTMFFFTAEIVGYKEALETKLEGLDRID